MFRTGPGPDAGGSNAKEKYLPHCPEKSGTAVMSAADAGDANTQPKPKMKSTRAVSMKRSGQKTALCVIQQTYHSQSNRRLSGSSAGDRRILPYRRTWSSRLDLDYTETH